MVLNRINKFQSHIFLIICCLISRVFTSIYYIEDIDSLRFAFSIQDYNIMALQPHFPGYPVFCFFAKILFYVTSNIAITFSLIGGISVFIIILYTMKLSKIKIFSLLGMFCTVFIFFNPLLWLMSNRYMPDIFGMAFAIMGMYYMIAKSDNLWYPIIGTFILGVLAGIRLSYVPLMILPLQHCIKKYKYKEYIMFSLSSGVIVWLIPMVWITGLENLLLAASKHTIGHFSDFGGTIITDDDIKLRLTNFFRSVWSDGLGGYWIGRSWVTLILSIPLCYYSYFGINYIMRTIKTNTISKLMLVSMVFYAFWILIFQNVIYKSRHVLPIVVIVLFFLINGQTKILYKNLASKIMMVLFSFSLFSLTSVLVIQHKNPTAISKLKDVLKGIDDKKTIISIPLVKYYLMSHNVKARYINVNNINQKNIPLNMDGAMVIGNYSVLFNDKYKITPDSSYYHNPYMNRMWSEIHTFRIKLK